MRSLSCSILPSSPRLLVPGPLAIGRRRALGRRLLACLALAGGAYRATLQQLRRFGLRRARFLAARPGALLGHLLHAGLGEIGSRAIDLRSGTARAPFPRRASPGERRRTDSGARFPFPGLEPSPPRRRNACLCSSVS